MRIQDPRQDAAAGGRGAPRVSVIVASRNAKATIEACLRSLAEQTCRDFEVIVADSSTDGTADLVARGFPEVRLLRFEGRKFPGDARNAGVEKARGEILAFIDSDCVAEPGWMRAIVAAHATPDLVIGGVVGNANPWSYIGWGAYFAEFSQWMPGLPERRMPDIPTCCLSIKRSAFDRFGPFLEGTYCSDTVFNWRALAGGHAPLFVPSIRVAHTNIESLRALLSKMAMHGRAFATIRTRERGTPAGRTVLLCAGSLSLLPIVLFCRAMGRVLRSRTLLTRFVLSSPVVLATQIAWSFGEAAGYARRLHPKPVLATAGGAA